MTVELNFKRPEDDKEQCQKVTERKVEESRSQVVIGVQVQDDCARSSIDHCRRLRAALPPPRWRSLLVRLVMPPIMRKKPGIVALSAALLLFAALAMTANVRKAHWQTIAWVTPSPDGQTLTATFIVYKSEDDDGRFCWEVTGTEVRESPSQVTIGVRMSNPCAPLLSWGTIRLPDNGRQFDVPLHLCAPLNGRTVIEKESGQKIEVAQQ
ncbi:hypothetical protein [Microbispora rosea]|uniref:hypothetical protein n=1 Tax=Microbispora rosea TaxID=58117 RepID=UPI00342CE6F1